MIVGLLTTVLPAPKSVRVSAVNSEAADMVMMRSQIGGVTCRGVSNTRVMPLVLFTSLHPAGLTETPNHSANEVT